MTEAQIVEKHEAAWVAGMTHPVKEELAGVRAAIGRNPWWREVPGNFKVALVNCFQKVSLAEYKEALNRDPDAIPPSTNVGTALYIDEIGAGERKKFRDQCWDDFFFLERFLP